MLTHVETKPNLHWDHLGPKVLRSMSGTVNPPPKPCPRPYRRCSGSGCGRGSGCVRGGRCSWGCEEGVRRPSRGAGRAGAICSGSIGSTSTRLKALDSMDVFSQDILTVHPLINRAPDSNVTFSVKLGISTLVKVISTIFIISTITIVVRFWRVQRHSYHELLAISLPDCPTCPGPYLSKNPNPCKTVR